MQAQNDPEDSWKIIDDILKPNQRDTTFNL